MKIVLISYGNVDFDGRLRSLSSVFSRLGDLKAITRGSKAINKNSITDNSTYLKFILNSIRFSKKEPTIDVLLLDNRKSAIPGLIIKKMCSPKTVILDCRELYLLNETKSIYGKIGCFFERKMAKQSDIVICANEERARIMKDEFCLSKEPISYENIRQLQYESNEKLEKAKEKLDHLFYDGEIRIISTSGCSIERTNDVLVEKINQIKRKSRLFLVGDSQDKDKEKIKRIIKNKTLNNVEIIDKLDQTELKYLISQCHIGIVNYGKYDTNNLYCASGKVYEFLYEGIPVVTTTNPPLRKLCETYNVGIADDEYADGINRIVDNYEVYKNNVQDFANEHTVLSNDKKLIESLKKNNNFKINL